MRRTVAVFALVTTLALAGCSMTPAGPEGAGGDSASSPAAPEQLTEETAGDAFLQLVAPYNGVLEQFEEAVSSEAPVEQQAGLAAATAAALRAEAEGLRNTPWPDSAVEDANALAEANEKAAAHWDGAAASSTTEEIMDHVDQAMEIDASDAAASLRETFGLPVHEEESSDDA